MRILLCAALLAAAGVISNDEAFLLVQDVATADDSAAQSKRAACPVDLAAANYRVLTSRCRWPPFDQAPCCAAFKDLACPYADYLNDVNGNDCADVLFRYMDLHGGYPPDVFYLNCRDGSKGLICPDGIPSSYKPPPPLHP